MADPGVHEDRLTPSLRIMDEQGLRDGDRQRSADGWRAAHGHRAPCQCLAFRSLPLVIWLALFTVAVTVFVVAYEQPTLRARYGASYDAYCRSVPAVVPRLHQRGRSTRPSSQTGRSDS